MKMESFQLEGLEKEDISRIHDRAMEVIERAKIQESGFIDLYGEETVSRDQEIVRKKKLEFGSGTNAYLEEQKKLADIFEALILENGELSEWFGSNAITHKTSDFDDINNGVDAVIEFESDRPGVGSFLGLAADVSFSVDTSKKFDRLIGGISEGKLPQVKYFNSSDGLFHGRLRSIPEVVIGLSKKTVLELAELWIRKRNKELANHKAQILILHQMEEQMEAFALYAEMHGQDMVAGLYRDRLIVVREILESKKDIIKLVANDHSRDEVNDGIMSFLKNWTKKIEEERV